MPAPRLPAGVTFERDAWLALVTAEGSEARDRAIAALEAARDATEVSEAEHAVRAAAAEGFGWIVGNDTVGFFPRHPETRYTRVGADGQEEVVDPPRRVLHVGEDGREVAAIDGIPSAPAEGAHRLVRRGLLTLEDAGGGFIWGLVATGPRQRPWRYGGATAQPDLGGAWLLDAAGQRIAWVPQGADAGHIVHCVNTTAEQTADTYRVGALRDSLDRLGQVVMPERDYQPPRSLRDAHAEALRAVDRLIAELPHWARTPGQPEWHAGGMAFAPPTSSAPLPAPAPAPVAGTTPPGPLPRPATRGRQILVFLLGLAAGWLAFGAR